MIEIAQLLTQSVELQETPSCISQLISDCLSVVVIFCIIAELEPSIILHVFSVAETGNMNVFNIKISVSIRIITDQFISFLLKLSTNLTDITKQ